IHSVSDAQLLSFVRTGLREFLVQTAMYVAALDRQASLPSIDESSPDCSARGDVNIGVIENKDGIFTSQFEHDGKQAFRRGRSNALSSVDTPGKNQFVDGRAHQRRSGRALADYNLEHVP